jgi:hypothetical protein
MSSRSRMTCQAIGARIAGSLKPEDGGVHLDFYPGYIRPDGKKISSKLVFKMYINDTRGEASRPITYRGTLWGVRAIGACKGFSVGKEMHFPALDVDPYMGRVWVNVNGTMQAVIGPDGQPILTDKVGYTVREMIYGNDSKKTIQSEIQAGIRPPMWDKEGHQDYQLWTGRIQARKSLLFNPQIPEHQTRFGYARVHMPAAGCTLALEDQTKGENATTGTGMTGYAATTGAAINTGGYAGGYTGGYAPAYTAGGFQGEVAKAANANGVKMF